MTTEKVINERFEIRESVKIGSFSIDTEPASEWAIAINAVLKKNRMPQRFQEIGAGGMRFATGIWTEAEAREVIKSARVNNNGEIHPDKKFCEEGKVGRNESQTFWVGNEIVDLLISGGAFKPKKGRPGEYKLIYPDWLLGAINSYNADIKCHRKILGKTKVTLILIPVRYRLDHSNTIARSK